MNQRTHGNVAHGHGITGLDRRCTAITDLVSGPDAFRRQDITAFTVRKQQQGKVRRPVWIVFNTLHLRRHIHLVALEVNNAITLLVTAAAMPGGDTTGIVTATILRLAGKQCRMGLALVQAGCSDLDDKSTAR